MENNDFIQWRSEYSIGLQEIDRQHQEIIALINSLLEICRENDNVEKYELFNKSVKIIIEHLQIHFAAEEKLMLEKRYPRYKEHKKRHDKLLEDIEKMAKKIKHEKQKMNLINMVIFLREWFVENIYGMDREMGEYLIAMNKKDGA